MLTELRIRQAQPRDKQYTLSDGRGLMLLVHPNGRKYWILRMWSNGKERRRSLGTWPDVTLKEARVKAYETRGKALNSTGRGGVFQDMAEQWLSVRLDGRSAHYVATMKSWLDRYILPKIGHMRMNDITPATVLALCQEIEALGYLPVVARVKGIVSRVFRYAILLGEAENEPTLALSGALRTAKTEHHPTITDAEGIAELMVRIRAYPYLVRRCALLFSVYTFQRPGEIRQAEWKEIDSKAALWKIPEAKMKMRRPHLVPLSRQVLGILEKLRPVTGGSKWLFPSSRSLEHPMAHDALRLAVRKLGYTPAELVPHGFRAMASTVLNEQGWPPDVIERQLAHVERNQVRAAYNRAEYLDERRRMVQAWADWLDSL